MHISRAALTTMLAEARAAYPLECCGALLGTIEGTSRAAVTLALAVPNRCVDRPASRYLIGPEDVRSVEREGERANLAVLGFYHSHPGHAAEPSALDRENAWPWYTYVIVPVVGGTAGAPRAWRLHEDRTRFIEREVDLREESA